LKKKKLGQPTEKYKMKNKLLESHTKWQVYSEMNTEVFARRLKRGVISDVCAMTAAF
jgi:polyphosphate kinase 2 (PPK2 family)